MTLFEVFLGTGTGFGIAPGAQAGSFPSAMGNALPPHETLVIQGVGIDGLCRTLGDLPALGEEINNHVGGQVGVLHIASCGHHFQNLSILSFFSL